MPVTAQTADESQVKAAYLYNFAKFVEWPSARFSHADDPLVICVVADEHTSDVLEYSTSAKKANGRTIQTRRPRSSKEFGLCHILFIGFRDKDHTADMLRETRNASILTVGQSADFLALGGMINLALRNGNMEIEIDPQASSQAGLKISSRLLVVARNVNGKSSAGGER